MKPCSGDIRHELLIGGEELRELKRHALGISEAFGLDRKLWAYKGVRPITLYRWDLECLLDYIAYKLADSSEHPDPTAAEYLALKRLGERFRQGYDQHYGNEAR